MAAAFKLKPSRCRWAGCDASTRLSFDSGDYTRDHEFYRGKCFTHGVWVLCRRHWAACRGPVLFIRENHCPECYLESQEGRDDTEAARRNASEEARQREALSRYEAAFRGQGYGQSAAEAMANKQFRDEQPPVRKWTRVQIASERADAEIERQIAVGELRPCPYCSKIAPCAQGVILAHDRGGREDPYIACEGEGTVVGR